jgi:hypothetical protein
MLLPGFDDVSWQAHAHEEPREGLREMLPVWRAKAKPFRLLSCHPGFKKTPRKAENFMEVDNPMIHVVTLSLLNIEHASVPDLAGLDIVHVLCPRLPGGILITLFLMAFPIFSVFWKREMRTKDNVVDLALIQIARLCHDDNIFFRKLYLFLKSIGNFIARGEVDRVVLPIHHWAIEDDIPLIEGSIR